MKKKKITFLGVVFGFILGFLTAVLIVCSFTGVFVRVPKPEIKEGEFGFALTYELDGERKVIEGTYVCKFEGTSRHLDGAGRQWTGYIKDHGDFDDYEIKETDEGVIMLSLDISPEFFMSDPFYESMADADNPKPEPYIYITLGEPSAEAAAYENFFSLYEGDDVKIISFEYDAPIENTYK